MSAAIQISRDTEGVRVEVQDKGDLNVLHELGPYFLEGNAEEWTFITHPEGIHACTISDTAQGLRFSDFRTGHGEGIKTGRFGPMTLDADIHNPEGFSVDLPHLHQRPWPHLRENEGCYDIGDQLMLTLAERINDRIDFCGMPIKDAIRLEGRKIPPNLRRFLPSGDAQALIRDLMAELRLPLVTH